MKKPKSFLVLGGARSGKTRYALNLAQQQPKRVYLATAQAYDDEMRTRIARHRAERDDTWTTIEEPIELASAIVRADQPNTTIVIDCLTLWLSNLIHAERDIAQATAGVIESIRVTQMELVFVSNEVGLAIVPENALARSFRDAQGRLNQEIAATVDQVDFIAAGLPLNLKPGVAR